MKNLVFVLGLISLIFLSFFGFRPANKSGVMSSIIIETVSKRLYKKYGLMLSSIGGGAREGRYWVINADYRRYNSEVLNMEDARKLILDVVDEYLNEINSRKDFRPYMESYPFVPRNIGVNVFLYNEKGELRRLPEISDVGICAGIISYGSHGPKIKLPYARMIEETYDEAIERVKEGSSSRDIILQ